MFDRLKQRIFSFLGLRPNVRVRAALLFLYFFLVIGSYYVIKPVRNSLFIERLGADNLPYVYIATALVAGLVITVYSRFADRIDRRTLILGTFGFLASNLVLFWWLLRAETVLASGAFYIWAKLYPLLLVSQFWLVANELFTTPQAKRTFGFIGAGGIIGGIAGSGVSGLLATRMGTEPLLFISVAILALCAGLVIVIDRVTEPVRQRSPALKEKQATGSWKLLRESSHLRTIACILGLTIVVSTIIDWQYNKAVDLFIEGEDAKTAFFGQFFAAINIASVLIQLLLTSWVLRIFGLGVALVLLPIGLLTGSIGIIAHPGLWTAIFAKGVEGSLRYSLDQSTRELLFLPLPSELKDQGKPFIDLFVYRGGTLVGGLVVLAGTTIFSFGLREMAIVALVLIGLWIGVTAAVRREFRSSVRRLISIRDVEPEELIIRHLDSRTRQELREALGSEDERTVLYALELLEDVEDEAIAERADELLEHPSERVRARTLQTLSSGGRSQDVEGARRLLEDPSMEVRVAAINMVCQFGPLPPQETLEGFLRSADPEIRASAITCLAQHSDSEQLETARNLLEDMARDRDGPGAARERELAAEAIGMLDGAGEELHEALADLLMDPDPGVRRAAVQAAGRVKRAELVPHLLAQLCCQGRRPDVKEALAAYGPAVFDQLADAMRDPRTPVEVRKEIPSIFYESAGQEAVETLQDLLLDVPPSVRRFALKTLNRMRRNHEGLSFDAGKLEPVLMKDLRMGYQAAADRGQVESRTLLAQVLAECQELALERSSRLLGLLYPIRDILAAYQGLTSESPAMRHAGLELLDNTLSLKHRRMAIPLADPELEPREKAERGASVLERIHLQQGKVVLERLAASRDNPWLAAVAAASLERDPSISTPELRQPYHSHSITGRNRPFIALLTESEDTMLKLIERADFLRDAEIFSEVRTEGLAKIAAITRERTYEEGDELFVEGDEGSEMFLIVSGTVEAIREEIVFAAERGDTVGTLSLIDARPREFTARAASHTRALVIERDDFFDLMRDHFDLAEGMLTHLSRVVRKLNERLESRAPASP